jgi:hypothetical protein
MLDKPSSDDAVAELIGRIGEKVRLGDDSGNGSGNGGGDSGEGHGGEDPLKGVPIDARALVNACAQVANFSKQIVLLATDRESALTMRVMTLVETAEERSTRELIEMSRAILKRIEAIEKHLGAKYLDEKGADDAGGGP